MLWSSCYRVGLYISLCIRTSMFSHDSQCKKNMHKYYLNPLGQIGLGFIHSNHIEEWTASYKTHTVVTIGPSHKSSCQNNHVCTWKSPKHLACHCQNKQVYTSFMYQFFLWFICTDFTQWYILQFYIITGILHLQFIYVRTKQDLQMCKAKQTGSPGSWIVQS